MLEIYNSYLIKYSRGAINALLSSLEKQQLKQPVNLEKLNCVASMPYADIPSWISISLVLTEITLVVFIATVTFFGLSSYRDSLKVKKEIHEYAKSYMATAVSNFFTSEEGDTLMKKHMNAQRSAVGNTKKENIE